MLGQIISAGIIISLFSIAVPFIFILWILKILSGSFHETKQCGQNKEMDEFSGRLDNLRSRIRNLEIIKEQKKHNKRGTL